MKKSRFSETQIAATLKEAGKAAGLSTRMILVTNQHNGANERLTMAS